MSNIKSIYIINQPLRNRGDESAHRCFIKALNDAFSEAKVTVLFEIASKKISENIQVKHPNNRYLVIHDEVNSPAEYTLSNRMLQKLFRGLDKLFVKHKLYFFAKYLPIRGRYYRELMNADLIINSPGGMDLGGFKTWGDLCRVNLAKMTGKPVAYYSRSIGPFYWDNTSDRCFSENCIGFFKSIPFLSLRDKKSMKIASENGIPYYESVDSAFLSVPNVDIPQSISDRLNDEYVVFVPNELRWHIDYKSKTADQIDTVYCNMIKAICDKWPGIQIVMMPQLYQSGKAGDFNYFQRIKDKSGYDNITIIDDTYSSDVQQAVISKAKIVIGARYHTIIWAINNARPFVALSYEHKMNGILEDLDCTKYSFNLKETVLNDLPKGNYMPDFIEKLRLAEPREDAQRRAHEKAIKSFDTFIEKIVVK